MPVGGADAAVPARIEHDSLLVGCGYKPHFVVGDEPVCMDRLMAGSVDAVITGIREIQRWAREANGECALCTPPHRRCPTSGLRLNLDRAFPSSGSGASLAAVRESPREVRCDGYSDAELARPPIGIARRNSEMSRDIVEGNWEQFKGKVRARRGKLTDDHLDVIVGKRAALAGKLPEMYGLTMDGPIRRSWAAKRPTSTTVRAIPPEAGPAVRSNSPPAAAQSWSLPVAGQGPHS